MSDTATPAETPAGEPHGSEESGTVETPTVEDLLAKVEEITGHSRKWEDRAKENREKAEQVDAALAEVEAAKASLADAEARIADETKRADDAEAQVARLTVAMEFGLSADDAKALASVADEDALRALAERLSVSTKKAPAPHPAQGRRSPEKPGPTNARDAFADVFDRLG